MTAGLVAAVDLGASSGRVMVGRVAPDELDLREVHRFPNEPVRLPDGLHWDILRLYREVLGGLREAARADDLASVGVDSWGVDFGLVDEAGSLLGDPYHYRDGRGSAAVDAVHAVIPPAELYARTGLQFLPFNTIYQLAAARGTPALAAAGSMLLIPDLIGFWLSGTRVSEVTNASTTALLDVRRRTWDTELIDAIGLPARICTSLGAPGDVVGPLRDAVRAETGVSPGTELVLVGSHDTASAVVGVPAVEGDFAYVACGTWGLVGVELDAPVLSETSRLGNFTNEGGVDGRIRYLRNVMGLWLLQEIAPDLGARGQPRGPAVAPRRGRRAARRRAGHRPRRPVVPAPGRHAVPDRRRLQPPRPGDPGHEAGARPVHPRQPGRGLRPGRPRCGTPVRPIDRRRPSRRRRSAQRAALPADRRCL